MDTERLQELNGIIEDLAQAGGTVNAAISAFMINPTYINLECYDIIGEAVRRLHDAQRSILDEQRRLKKERAALLGIKSEQP